MSVNWLDVETVGFKYGIEFEAKMQVFIRLLKFQTPNGTSTENFNKIHSMPSCGVVTN